MTDPSLPLIAPVSDENRQTIEHWAGTVNYSLRHFLLSVPGLLGRVESPVAFRRRNLFVSANALARA
jgi:hypothetical protein